MHQLRSIVRRALFVLVVLCVPLSRARAQDTTSTRNLRVTDSLHVVQLVLRDGTTLVGRVVEVTPTTVRFASSIGETTIARANIAGVRASASASVHDGEFWPEDPSRTRLFFAPTGRMLRAGEVYFSDVFVLFPNIQGGVTDHFTLGGGISLFPFVHADEQLYYLTPKVGVYSSPRLNIAVGALVAGAKSITDESPVGLGYGVVTFGGEDGNVTVGTGFGFSRHTATSTSVLMVGGIKRVSRNVALVSENYITSSLGSNTLYSGGVRLMSDHIAVDLALAGASNTEVPLPYVAFIYKW